MTAAYINLYLAIIKEDSPGDDKHYGCHEYWIHRKVMRSIRRLIVEGAARYGRRR